MHLQIKQADIGYHKTLISNATAHLKLGEVCLLIGNNGVGKTTLIKSILHQIPLLSGEISIHNKNVKNLSVKEIAEQIAVVFSSSVIPPNYTVEDLISLGKYIYYPFYFELKKKTEKKFRILLRNSILYSTKILCLKICQTEIFRKHLSEEPSHKTLPSLYWMNRLHIWMKKTKLSFSKPFGN